MAKTRANAKPTETLREIETRRALEARDLIHHHHWPAERIDQARERIAAGDPAGGVQVAGDMMAKFVRDFASLTGPSVPWNRDPGAMLMGVDHRLADKVHDLWERRLNFGVTTPADADTARSYVSKVELIIQRLSEKHDLLRRSA